MAWKKMKLGEVLINREGRYKPNDAAIANYKRIDKINFSGNIFLSNKDSNTDMILIKKGDLVISGINVEKGAIAVYVGEEDITATIHYSSYIFNTNKIDIEFLKVFLRSPDFILLLKEQVPGGIKTEIKPKHIMPMEVFFPDTLEEQKRIAKHFFEKEKKFIQLKENLANQLTQLSNLNQAILQEAVQGKLVKQNPKDEPASELLQLIKAEKAKSGKKEKPLPPIKPSDIPFEIPENWVWCRLFDIISILGDGLHGTPNYDKSGEYYFINGNNLINGKIEIKDTTKRVSETEFLKHRKHLIHNTVFVSINGTLGNLAYYNGEKIILGKSACYFNLHQEILREYIGVFIKSSYFLKYAVEVASETTIKNVSLKSMRLLPIPLPPLSEQKRIVSEIEKQLAKTKQLKEHIIANQQATEQLLKALLHQAFEVEEMELV